MDAIVKEDCESCGSLANCQPMIVEGRIFQQRIKAYVVLYQDSSTI